MTDEEIWKPVIGGEGVYEVSSHGRIRRLWKNHSRIRAPRLTRGGYLYTTLGSGIKPRFVHVAVLESFVGPRPDGMFSDHIDYDRTNNRLDNLRWVTRAQNVAHSMTRNLSANQGEANFLAKLTVDAVREIRSGKIPLSTLAKKYRVSYVTAWLAKKRKTWKHVP